MATKPVHWTYTEAEKAAQGLVSILRPACVRIEIAGSLRRKSTSVGDIEILYISKDGGNEILGAYQLMQQEIEALSDEGILAKRLNKLGRPTWGELNQYAVHVASGIGVDFFATTLENWGMSLLVRTGSKDFNQRVMQRFKRLGMRGHAYGGITGTNGLDILCPDEETVFELLGWNFIQPEHRD